MVGKFLGSLFSAAAARSSDAEQGTAPVLDQNTVDLGASGAALDALRSETRRAGGEVPTGVYSQFRQIDDLLATLVVHMQQTGAATEQVVLAGAIICDYLPTSLRTYLMLPKSVRVHGSHETATLLAQLATLHSTVQNLNQQVRSGAATELAIHGRFLQDKFDLGSLHLEGS
ncbi:hypothetical protein J7I84_19700 [Arthrobacter sp. ISL-85]|uniref:hypothetical protein n=1 Tax=Arthrobacter sp. ISL-85 TaxID=2819115 RepID=UPI001BEB24BD|nr:hypothetical protein [Arthrobacter sp. ISL-85]MBT2568671.1 hypothetical protein [Arthrobacter sp. ISL-85]